MVVKEFTGDMQLTKKEVENTQILVSTPEKWDVVTRKSTENLTSLVKLLIIDEVRHSLSNCVELCRTVSNCVELCRSSTDCVELCRTVS